MPGESPFNKLQIIKIIRETENCKTFVLKPLEDWTPGYKSGQFLTLVFNTKHGEKRRSYSISSAPELDQGMTITVKKIDNGEFSRLLNYHAKVGDVLNTMGVSGFFTLPEDLSNWGQFFFIVAGSGITPCFSIIKTLLAKTDKKVVLIYSNKNQSETIFHESLKTLEKKYPERLRLKFLFSDRPTVYESRLSNWLLPQLLDAYLQVKNNEARFYVCGPFDYMRMVEITLLSRFPKTNIVKENFSHWPRLILPVPPDTDPHEVIIHYKDQTHTLRVQYPVNILGEAKKQNITLPYSCEAGRCGSCVATCSSGKVWMAYNEVLTDKEVNNGRILVCQAYPVAGPVEITF